MTRQPLLKFAAPLIIRELLVRHVIALGQLLADRIQDVARNISSRGSSPPLELSRRFGKHRPFVYGLIQRDYNKDDTSDIVSPAIHTRFRYDSWYLGLGSQGAITDRENTATSRYDSAQFQYQGRFFNRSLNLGAIRK